MRRTKIVATIGPATRSSEALGALIDAGVDVVRVNFAHDTPDAHQKTVTGARELAGRLDRTVGALVDLPGPKMRTGPIEGDEVELQQGEAFVLTDDDAEGNAQRVSTTVAGLGGMVSEGEEIYLADGEIVLRVDAVEDGDVRTEIVRGGMLRSRKGMHVPGAERAVQAFTEGDRRALEVALTFRPDLVGLSFVRDADDVSRARDALPKRGHRPMLLAKIETASALQNLGDIIDAADAVMVARGDLGIQMRGHLADLRTRQ